MVSLYLSGSYLVWLTEGILTEAGVAEGVGCCSKGVGSTSKQWRGGRSGGGLAEEGLLLRILTKQTCPCPCVPEEGRALCRLAEGRFSGPE